MAKNKNTLSSLGKQLTSSNVAGIDLAKALKPTTLGGTSSATSRGSGKPPSLGDTRKLSFAGKTSPTGIQFGRPSNSKTSATQSGSVWTSLLKQTISSGSGSGLTGGLSSLGGIGGLFSGIMSLFGGGGTSTLPALVDFKLPTSASQTVYVGSSGSSTYQGDAVEKAVSSSTVTNQPAGTLQLQYQSAAIAQAVKTAMLNSSSLNDVIAEL